MEYNLEIETIKALCIGKTERINNIYALKQYKILGMLCMHRCAGIAYYHLMKNNKLNLLTREMSNTLLTIFEGNKKSMLLK